MLELSTIFHTGPVTALCCHGNSVIAGIGSQVHVYNTPDCKLRQSVEILPARVVHGIKHVFKETERASLVVYGQKCLRLVEFDSSSQRVITDSKPIEFSDWIWDVTSLQGEDPVRRLCIALGHNVIVIYDVDTLCITNSIHCQEKCILYCAKFLTSQPDCVMLAAGTVFNQVVIWSAQSKVNSTERVEPVHRLTGHQGVIFSVDYDPKSHIICSVSDDRSVRLYRLLFPESSCGDSVTDWERMDSSLMHVLYGHSARVWDVQLLSSSFVSVGEDSTCIVWSYDGKILNKFKGHKGKSIWSMCVDNGENFVLTGGGDNSVRLWYLQGSKESQTSDTRSLDLKLDLDDFPRNTMLLDTDRILAITNMGKLMLYDQRTDQCTCLMFDEKFGSYTVIDVCRDSGRIAVGNIHGTLRILYQSECSSIERPEFLYTDVTVCEGKLFSVVWLERDKVVTTASHGHVNIWSVKIGSSSLLSIELNFTFVLPPCKHRWVSAASLVERGNHVVVGDRTGSVYLYRLSEENKTGDLIQPFPKIHGKAGVTFVSCHDNQIYTAGRDGIYRSFNWTESGQLELLHNNKVCKGFDWIERLNFTDEDDIQVHGFHTVCKGFDWIERLNFTDDDDIQVHGFHTNLFVIWSVKQNQKLLEIECGGGHRSWDYCCHGNNATFVHVKTREVKVTNVEMKSNQVIVKKCLHGRELCDAKQICTGIDKSGNSVAAIVTCSEDTSLCLSFLYYSKELSRLDIQHSLTGHISSVRCLYVCSSSQHEASATQDVKSVTNRKLIFSGGGRAQLKVWSVEVRYAEVCKTRDTSKLAAGCDGSSGTTGHRLDTCDQNQAAQLTAEKVSYKTSVPLNDEQFMNNVKINECENLNVSESERCDKFNNIKDNNASSATDWDTSMEDNFRTCDLSYTCLTGLQLSNIHRKCKKPWRQPLDNSDPETRILDLSVVTPEELGQTGSRPRYLISAACSDGLLRLLLFDETSREISMVTSTSFHDHCVLKTTHVVHHVTQPCDIDHVAQSNQSDFRIIILSAATDGQVAFWDVSKIYKEAVSSANSASGILEVSTHDSKQLTEKPLCVLQLHQSGINSVYFGKYSDDSYILVTGGDDNAVHINIVTMETEDDKVNVKVVAEGCDINAHSAQITGVWFIGPDYIVTASIDQRICLWRLILENSSIKLRMCGCKFTSVSDVSNIDVWSDRGYYFLLISGNGLEVFKLCKKAE